MPVLGKESLRNLRTCHEDLQKLVYEVIQVRDIKVTAGYRGEKEQNACFANHTSMLKYPQSLHNKEPSLAVDIVPYPELWDSPQAFMELSVIIKDAAKKLGISIQWGGDWKKFKDLPHWELKL